MHSAHVSQTSDAVCTTGQIITVINQQTQVCKTEKNQNERKIMKCSVVLVFYLIVFYCGCWKTDSLDKL